MKRCKEDVTALQLRLKKIVGQLNGVQKMLEADAPCEDIITQMNAANGALHRLSDEKMVAVQWKCSGTFNGEERFGSLFDEAAKSAHRDAQFPIDLANACALGKRLVANAKAHFH